MFHKKISLKEFSFLIFRIYMKIFSRPRSFYVFSLFHSNSPVNFLLFLFFTSKWMKIPDSRWYPWAWMAYVCCWIYFFFFSFSLHPLDKSNRKRKMIFMHFFFMFCFGLLFCYVSLFWMLLACRSVELIKIKKKHDINYLLSLLEMINHNCWILIGHDLWLKTGVDWPNERNG